MKFTWSSFIKHHINCFSLFTLAWKKHKIWIPFIGKLMNTQSASGMKMVPTASSSNFRLTSPRNGFCTQQQTKGVEDYRL